MPALPLRARARAPQRPRAPLAAAARPGKSLTVMATPLASGLLIALPALAIAPAHVAAAIPAPSASPTEVVVTVAWPLRAGRALPLTAVRPRIKVPNAQKPAAAAGDTPSTGRPGRIADARMLSPAAHPACVFVATNDVISVADRNATCAIHEGVLLPLRPSLGATRKATMTASTCRLHLDARPARIAS